VPRKVRLTLTCLVVLAVSVAVAAMIRGSGDDDEPGSADGSIGTAVTEPAPSPVGGAGDSEYTDFGTDTTDQAGGDQPAPAGSAPGVWWRPGRGESSPSLVWVFNPATNSGYQREYRPTGIDGPFQSQHLFTYDPGDSGVRLSFLSVTSANPHDEVLTSLDYDSSDGVLRVDRDGSSESWFGCTSSEMPALASVLC
jgi:hypothetical protein